MKRLPKLDYKQKVEFIFITVMFGLMVLAFYSLILPGITSFGDWYYPNPDRLLGVFKWPSVIQDYAQIGFYGGLFAQRFLQESIFTYFVSWGISHTILTNVFYLLPGPILSVTGMWLLTKNIYKNSLVTFVASLLYTFNTYPILLFSGGHILISVAYGLAPWIVLTARKLLSKPSWLYLLGLVLLVSVQSAYDPRIVYITAICVLILSIIEYKKKLFTRFYIKWILLFIILFALTNIYWLYPFLFVNSGSTYLASSTDVNWVDTLSYTNVWHALTLSHVWWPGVLGLGAKQAPYLFFIFIPVIALIGYLGQRKFSKVGNALLVVLLLGVFLTKGSNPPFGDIYRWLFQYLPGFNVFRDPAKFFVLTALPMSLLFGAGVNIIWVWSKNHYRRAIRLSLLAVLFVVFGIGYKEVWLGQLGGNLNKLELSNQVNEKLDELNTNNSWYRVLWLPMHYRFVLHNSDHPSIDGNDTMMQNTVWSQIPGMQKWLNNFGEAKAPNFNYVLQALGVKYLALAGDPIDDIYGINYPTTQKKFQKMIEELNIFTDRIDVKDSQGAVSNLFFYPTHLSPFYVSSGLIMLDNSEQLDLLSVRSPADYAIVLKHQTDIITEQDSQFVIKKTSWELDQNGVIQIRVKDNDHNKNPHIGIADLPKSYLLTSGRRDDLVNGPFDSIKGDVYSNVEVSADGVVPVQISEEKIEDYLSLEQIDNWQKCPAYSDFDNKESIINISANNLHLTSNNGVSGCLEMYLPNKGAGLFILLANYESNNKLSNIDVDFINRGNQQVMLSFGGQARSILEASDDDYKQIRIRINAPAKTKGDLRIDNLRFSRINQNGKVFALIKNDLQYSKNTTVQYSRIDAEDYLLTIHNNDGLPAILNFSMAYNEGWKLVHKKTGQVVGRHLPNIVNTNTWIIDGDLNGEFQLRFDPINKIRWFSYLSLITIIGQIVVTIHLYFKKKEAILKQ